MKIIFLRISFHSCATHNKDKYSIERERAIRRRACATKHGKQEFYFREIVDIRVLIARDAHTRRIAILKDICRIVRNAGGERVVVITDGL